MSHGHRLHYWEEEWELCTDLKCPCEDLGMTQDEIDMLDDLSPTYPIVVEFQTYAGQGIGDIHLIWEFDYLDVGWNSRTVAFKAANWYQRDAERKPRIVPFDEPEMSENRGRNAD